MNLENEVSNNQCQFCGGDMETYLNYFENYYKEHYDAHSFYADDNVFQCTFPDQLRKDNVFTIKLLSLDAYVKMHQRKVLDKYLEILKIRDSSCSRDVGLRNASWGYNFKVEECLVSKMDEILPYITEEWDETMIPLSNFSLFYIIKKKRGASDVIIMDGDTYTPGQLANFVTIYSVGEVEEAELILSER